MIISLFGMAGSCIFAYSAFSEGDFIFWFRWTITFLLIYMGVATHFCISIAGIIKLKHIAIILLYFPTPIFIFKNWTSLFYMKNFIKIDNIWWLSPNPPDIWYYILSIYFTIYTIISLVFLFLWMKKERTIRKKRQAIIMFITLSITFIMAMGEGIIIPLFTGYNSFALGPIAIAIWIFGIFYCFVKYRFMAPSLEMVSGELSNNIDEIIILLGYDLSILFMNKTALEIAGLSKKEIAQKRIEDVIKEANILKPELESLLKQDITNSIACHITVLGIQDKILDSRFSIIKDKFYDTVGILIIGKEIKSIQKLKNLYKITSREFEIIREIYQGSSNKNIADILGISERTVKFHLTNIFNKLNINNKIQLMSLLEEYQLTSVRKADKKLLLIDK
jgi:DNA-binding NarL/FixJ family response regulator